MSSIKPWLAAARLRTLPLAFSCIILGNFLAANEGSFDGSILILSLLTTLLFQVLSNYANDYGDGVKGTDDHRKGEKRMVSAGIISRKSMKRAVYLLVVLSFISASLLSYIALIDSGWTLVLLFIALGCLAILAALFYTIGDTAYGYSGWGDFFVLLFFGWVGVMGSYYIQTAQLSLDMLMPSSAVGLLAVGVLNLNNMRDIQSDKVAGKFSIPVRIGLPWAKAYHVALVVIAFDLAFFYAQMKGGDVWRNLFLLTAPLLLWNLSSVFKAWKSEDFEPLLKRLAITTLLFSILLGLGIYLSN